MDFDIRKEAYVENESKTNNVDVRDIVEKYLRYWKWFLLGVILSVLCAYVYLNFQRKQFQAVASIKIKNEGGSELAAFQDLGVIPTTNQIVEDEMEILLSKDLIATVIKSLNFNVQLLTNKNPLSNFLDSNLGMETAFYENDAYVDPPLKLNFLIPNSKLYKTSSQFVISIKSTNEFTFTEELEEKTIMGKYAFGEKVKASFGDVLITPSDNFVIEDIVNTEILVKVIPVKDLAAGYASVLVIEPRSETSNILTLKINDSRKEKAEDFLNKLVEKYNQRAINLKEELSKSTSDFVTKRLEIISDELSDVDLTAESIKTRYRISDDASNTIINMQSGQDIENRIVVTQTELEKIGFIKDFVQTKERNDLIPVDFGVADNSVTNDIQKYNQIMLEKKRLLKNSTEKNPIIANLNDQLNTIKGNIDEGLDNLESAQQISLDALNKQDVRINSRLYSAPRQERQYRNIQRQQQIKERLYLYLLEKREETALTLGVADPDADLIDSPLALPFSVKPKKKQIYFLFCLIGLLIPFAIIYIADLLNTKMHTREEIQNALNIPMIGDIPKLDTKRERYTVSKSDNSGVAEAFRILRTNINFIFGKERLKSKGKTIYVTSTIAHEGKSFVAVNLATTIAHTGKRTLIVGLDIRAPKIDAYLSYGSKKNVGITNYIIGNDLKIKDIIYPSLATENLFIMPSGDIAPNPTELLLNDKIDDLFESIKEDYDYIIVDTAAYSMVTDTLIVSKFADMFVYVIRANFLDKRMLKYIKALYHEKKLSNMNVLVNGLDYKRSYGYGYGYGYGEEFEKNKKAWWKFGLG